MPRIERPDALGVRVRPEPKPRKPRPTGSRVTLNRNGTRKQPKGNIAR